MDDFPDNGDNGGGDDNGGAGATPQRRPKTDDPGWKEKLEAAFEYAWEESTRDPNCVYDVNIFVKGRNPISGYRVFLIPGT